MTGPFPSCLGNRPDKATASVNCTLNARPSSPLHSRRSPIRRRGATSFRFRIRVGRSVWVSILITSESHPTHIRFGVRPNSDCSSPVRAATAVFHYLSTIFPRLFHDLSRRVSRFVQARVTICPWTFHTCPTSDSPRNTHRPRSVYASSTKRTTHSAQLSVQSPIAVRLENRRGSPSYAAGFQNGRYTPNKELGFLSAVR